MSDGAMVAAEAADAEIAAGRYRGPLHGVPLGVKDLFWTNGVATAAGMPIHRDFRPAEDATAAARLRQAGAVLLGKLKMTEGAYSDHHPSVTPPKNPWNADYWPWHLLQRTGRGDGRWPVLRRVGVRYRRVNPLAVWCDGAYWPEADMGAGQPLRGGRACRNPRPRGANSPQRRRCRRDPRGDRGQRLQGSNRVAGSCARLPGLRRARVHEVCASGSTRDGTAMGSMRPCTAVLRQAVETFRSMEAIIIEVAVPDVTQAIIVWAPACAVEAAVAHEATYPRRRDEYGAVLASVLDMGAAVSRR